LVFILALPLVLLNIYLKGRELPSYRKRRFEHFGWFRPIDKQPTIWVHAVSVGESLAAMPIIKRIQKERPELQVVVTTTTPTGAERVEAMLGDSVIHLYSPYDFPWVVKRFIRKISPMLTIVMETELWPNMIHHHKKRGIPIVVVNARLSARSALSYARLPIPTKKLLLDPLTHLACQSESDAERFVKLGADRTKISVTGSVKFDLQLPSDIDSTTKEIFGAWLSEGDSFIWAAGSTHVGEDEILLSVQRKLFDHGIKAKLILVPRHPERFDSVAELIEQRGFLLSRRSTDHCVDQQSDVFLCDSMGEMMFCYRACHLAFVGGSLIERGGHNPLEPAALAKPVLTGKHIFNFSDVYRNMIDEKAAEIVNEQSLEEKLLLFAEEPGKAQSMGKRGLSVVESNRGSISKTLKILYRYLPASKK